MDKDNRKLPVSQSSQKGAKVYTGTKDFSLDRFEQEVADEMHVGINSRRPSGGMSTADRSNIRSKRPTDTRNTDKC